MSDLTARENEITAVLNRHRFDDPPGDLTNETDLLRWREFRAAYHRAQQLSDSVFPLQVDFELTSQCNMTCPFCEHGQRKVPMRVLPVQYFERAICEGQEHGLCSVKLNYINEPLLDRELPERVRFAKAHGVLNVYFATNGVLLSERMSSELIDARLSKVMVSLDAATPETFATMRKSKHWELILRNVDTFLAVRARRQATWPMLRVNFLRTPHNIGEMDAFVRRWTGVADAIGLQDCVGLPGVQNDLTPVDARLYRQHGTFGCSFPFKLVVIDSSGSILPCCTFSGRQMPIGHMSDSTIARAWSGVAMRQLKEMHARRAYTESPVCTHCMGDHTSAAPVIPIDSLRSR